MGRGVGERARGGSEKALVRFHADAQRARRVRAADLRGSQVGGGAQDVFHILLADGAGREGGEAGLHEEDDRARPKQVERVRVRLVRRHRLGESGEGLWGTKSEPTRVNRRGWERAILWPK